MLLTYHAALARPSSDRIATLLGIRDAMMADNLSYILARQQRGRVLVFAHNSHVKRGQAHWQLGPNLLSWWPAGAQISEVLGARYAVIGTGVGRSDTNGISTPEPDTLEALLSSSGAPIRFVSTRQMPATGLCQRSGSAKNPTYFPLSAQSVNDFDGLLVADSVTYSRGGPVLP
jgi:erythromycin esterase-like protein